MTRLLYLHVVGTEPGDESATFAQQMQGLLAAAVREGTQVDVVTLPASRPRHVDYHAYEALVIPDVVHHVYAASRSYDGAVIGCFYDLGLREAREVSDRMVVTAPCQATTDIALSLGNTFSVLVGGRKNIPRMRDNIRLYGRDHALASMRPLGLSVWEQQRSPDTYTRMLEAGRACVEEDGAEVIILGCTAGFGFHERLGRELGVPVLDAMLAPLKYAEFLADTASRFSWYPSRKWGSASPPQEEVLEWRLFDGEAPTGSIIKHQENSSDSARGNRPAGQGRRGA